MNTLKRDFFNTNIFCNGNCALCINPCYIMDTPKQRSKKITVSISDKEEEVIPISPEEEKAAEKAFDTPVETGLSVIDNIGTFELSKNLFGKERVRKIK